MEQIEKKYFSVSNPYNQHISVIPATPTNVHTIVFWSKDFGYFIQSGFGKKLIEMGFHLFFNFTINSKSILEPNVPSLEKRLDQLAYLCDSFGPETINWRFDPVCFFHMKGNDIQNNLQDFPCIAEKAGRFGIKRCVTSFMDDYPKIRKRLTPGFSFIDPPLEQKINIILWMKNILSLLNIQLMTCCEKEVIYALGPESGVKESSCIPNDLLLELFGGELSLKQDKNQRVKQGCKCMVSKDIGSYNLHPCFHRCVFCYANPAASIS